MTDNSREGWIEWSGGENPVPGQEVEYFNREMVKSRRCLSDNLSWSWSTQATAWQIVRYRIVTAADDRGDGHEGRQPVVSKGSPDELAIAVERVKDDMVRSDPSPLAWVSRSDLRLILSRLAELKAAKWDVQHVDTMNDAVSMGMEIDRLTALVKAQEETIRADGEALKPFARYLDVLEVMGGNTPRTGTYCGASSSSMGDAEITIEDMQAARARLSARQEGGDAILNEGQT